VCVCVVACYVVVLFMLIIIHSFYKAPFKALKVAVEHKQWTQLRRRWKGGVGGVGVVVVGGVMTRQQRCWMLCPVFKEL